VEKATLAKAAGLGKDQIRFPAGAWRHGQRAVSAGRPGTLFSAGALQGILFSARTSRFPRPFGIAFSAPAPWRIAFSASAFRFPQASGRFPHRVFRARAIVLCVFRADTAFSAGG